MLPIILASQSPRRQELLTAAGIAFRVVAPSARAEDGERPGETVRDLVGRLALQKAADVAPRVAERDAIVIACDTVAEVQGRVLGKPRNREHAREMLLQLSGRRHRVLSGLCVYPISRGKPCIEVCESEPEMCQLADTQMLEYLDSGAWEGKSGAFGYQDGHPWLTLISGTSDNVVGLPIATLKRMLEEFA